MAGNEFWEKLVVRARGEAGTWLAGFQPLPRPTNQFTYETGLNFRAESSSGEPTSAFVFNPTVTLKSGDGWRLPEWNLDPQVKHDPQGGELLIRTGHGASWGLGPGQEANGYFFAVGASSAWEFDLWLNRGRANDSSPERLPSFLVAGNGTQFGWYDTKLAGVINSKPGLIEVRAQVDSPGWSHLQVLYDRPAGRPMVSEDIRHNTITFPDGTKYECVGRNYEHRLLSDTTSSGISDYYGTFTDVAGSLVADVQTLGTPDPIQVGFVHMPGSLGPAFGRGGYSEWGHDPLIPYRC